MSTLNTLLAGFALAVAGTFAMGALQPAQAQTAPITTPEPVHHCVHAAGYIACKEGTWKAELVLPPRVVQRIKNGTGKIPVQRVVQRMRGCLRVTVKGTQYIACNKRTWKVTRVDATVKSK